MNKGLLLVNLGSPDSTEVKDVRSYLREFLMDSKVLDLPYWKRKLIVECFILPTRPAKSAEAYKKIWTEDGSPLIVISKKLSDKVAQKLDIPVALAMRYKNPSIEHGLQKLYDKGVRDVLVIPLYPQYTMSTTETVADKIYNVQQQKFADMDIMFLKAFYNHPNYISVLAKSIKQNLPEHFDKLLFSYHGIPVRHDDKAIAFGKKNPDLNVITYREQCFETTELVRKELGLTQEQVQVSFQSRLGKDPWIQPYTDIVLKESPQNGVKNLVVVAPAFVSDCLETLEEIAIEGKEQFLNNGGQNYTYIPCLNEEDNWAETLAKWTKGWSER